ncbi:13095_t:CDS:1, partial [Gigaspora rosea]
KSQESVVPESSHFELYLKHWQEPYNVLCSTEFKTINNEKLTNISVNAFKMDQYKSVETGNVK